MRVVSGKFGGRRLIVPKGRDIRPTSDKVRGAVFNSLQSRGVVQGARVIDCFAGTGALGLEAISQGAHFCMFVDHHRTSLDLAKENSENFSLTDEVSFLKQDARRLASRAAGVELFTLAFLDPPYGQDLVGETLGALDGGGWLEVGALCVVEVEKAYQGLITDAYSVIDERLYGDTKILTLSYSSAPK